MNGPRAAATALAADRSASRRFRHGVPDLWVMTFGGDRVYSCPALAVGVSLSGDRASVETRFVRDVRAAAAAVDPATAPADAVATALAVERATDDECRSWIRGRDPAVGPGTSVGKVGHVRLPDVGVTSHAWESSAASSAPTTGATT